MNKQLTAILVGIFMIVASTASAEHSYVPILQEGHQWVYERVGGFVKHDPPLMMSVKIAGDTIVSGHNCKIIEYGFNDSPRNYAICYEENCQVYLYYKESDGYEHWPPVLYDGEEFAVAVDFSEEFLQQISSLDYMAVDMIEISGSERIRYGYFDETSDKISNCVVEGIGDFRCPSGTAPVSQTSDASFYVLRSFTDNGVELLTDDITRRNPTLIDMIDADENSLTEYFDLTGMKVDNPHRGHIYILRQGSKVSKIIMP